LRILVIGGGKTAREFLKLLDLRKHAVTVIEKDPHVCSELTKYFDVSIICRDATEGGLYLSEIDIREYDAVIALTNRDEVNLFILMLAKAYGIPIRIARVTDSALSATINKLDLGSAIVVPEVIARTIHDQLAGTAKPFTMFASKEYELMEMTVSDTDKIANKKLNELEYPKDKIHILAVFDGEKLITPSEDFEIKPNQRVIMLISKDLKDEITKYFK